MKPIYSIHPGEFLVGNAIEKLKNPSLQCWIPASDKGVDLLVTDNELGRFTTVQVKYSRHYIDKSEGLQSAGWNTFSFNSLKKLDS